MRDLATAYYISDRIIIMQQGYIVEMGPAQAVLESPEHPYTRLLKESVLSVDDPGRVRVQAPDRRLAVAAAETSGSGTLRPGEEQRLAMRAASDPVAGTVEGEGVGAPIAPRRVGRGPVDDEALQVNPLDEAMHPLPTSAASIDSMQFSGPTCGIAGRFVRSGAVSVFRRVGRHAPSRPAASRTESACHQVEFHQYVETSRDGLRRHIP